MRGKIIYHQGIIDSITEDKVIVRIRQTSACTGCGIRTHCMTADEGEKLIEVNIPDGKVYEKGDLVTIEGKESMGIHAVLWAFVLPLIILLFFLILFITWSKNEVLSTLGAVLLLVLYYYILWLKRDKFKQEFLFSIKGNSKSNIK